MGTLWGTLCLGDVMLETALVVLIAFSIFMLFWVIVFRAKQQKKHSPIQSCGACSEGCGCTTPIREALSDETDRDNTAASSVEQGSGDSDG